MERLPLRVRRCVPQRVSLARSSQVCENLGGPMGTAADERVGQCASAPEANDLSALSRP